MQQILILRSSGTFGWIILSYLDCLLLYQSLSICFHHVKPKVCIWTSLSRPEPGIVAQPPNITISEAPEFWETL